MPGVIDFANGRIIDLSSNNDAGNVPTVGEFKALRDKAHVIAVIVKATGGGDPGNPKVPPYKYENPGYKGTRNNCVRAGIPAIAYHFWQPGISPIAQVAFFRAVAGTPWARVLDVEMGTDFAAYATALMALGVARGSRSLYGSMSALAGARPPAQKWIADFGTDAPNQPPDPIIETAARKAGATMLQYGSDETLPGLVGAVDKSVWLGSQEQFEALFHVPAVHRVIARLGL